MKNLLILILLVSVSCSRSSLTFKATDYKATGMSSEKIQEKKQHVLGAKIEITFYDSSAKMTVYEKDGSIEEEWVLDKDENEKDVYILEDDILGTGKLVLKRTLGYINSATWTAYKRGDTIKITLKRD